MAKRGRPPKEPEELLSEPIVIKFTVAEKVHIDAAAKKAPFKDRASWLHYVVLKAADRLNGKPKG
jgi:hypothetical protein